MKTQFIKRSQQGFTLVELLVVIVIIAVLATLGTSVGIAALQKARKVTAQAAATDIANAVEQFYSEYNMLPAPDSGAPDEDNKLTPYETNSGNGIQLLDVLAGFEEEQNERKLRFLGVKESDDGRRNGVVYNGTGDAVTGLFDPWGEPYYIILDYDYDGRIEISVPLQDSNINTTLNNKRVAIYSLGTDTPTEAKRKDLVKTW